jgi:quinol monooxygenase YgiN
MVYAVTVYKVRAADVCAFKHAFGKSGKWQTLHRDLPGYVHSDLMVHADFPTVFLLLEFWQSARDVDMAQQRTEVRAFSASLRTIAVSHLSLGTFSFRARTDLNDFCALYQDFPIRVADLK